MSIFERISGFLYPIVIAGVCLGFLWNGVQWLAAKSDLAGVASSPIVLVSAVLANSLLAWLLERIMPLRALSELRWVYHERPRGGRRSFDVDSVVQLCGQLVFGVVTGVAVGHPVLGACGAVALRVVFAMIKPASLPVLLAAGRTRLVGLAAFHVQDNQLASDAFAEMWIRWRSIKLPSLTLRRLMRRSYLLLIALIQIATAVVLTTPLGPSCAIVFVCAWTILGAGVYRCADTSKLTDSTTAGFIVLGCHALLGGTVAYLLWQLPLVWLLGIVASIGYGSYKRGQPRRVVTLTFMENGMGISVPMELIDYYGKGLLLSGLLTAVALLFR
ncbi:hypothetical protein WG915_04330 [Corynebacterium sp. H128]|uniref:hypothetical protein n=1 Tax=unclassified Corynebacterium TaxID=2624378 RepID=UPI003094EB25